MGPDCWLWSMPWDTCAEGCKTAKKPWPGIGIQHPCGNPTKIDRKRVENCLGNIKGEKKNKQYPKKIPKQISSHKKIMEREWTAVFFGIFLGGCHFVTSSLLVFLEWGQYHIANEGLTDIVGWWFEGHPSEKYESIGMIRHSQDFWENKIHGNHSPPTRSFVGHFYRHFMSDVLWPWALLKSAQKVSGVPASWRGVPCGYPYSWLVYFRENPWKSHL